MMNCFKYVSSRRTWCQLKRLQSSSSNSTLQIPTRIERGPTDILKALASTIPEESNRTKYIYHDDPYLIPRRRQNYRQYALSYESGKKTAMWIHNEHGSLFPIHLSDPPIKAFKPPVKYTSKTGVSEALLLKTISKCKVSEAIHIYELLETNVSNATKQALLELLCFCNSKDIISDEFPYENFYTKTDSKLFWQPIKHVEELYKFLIDQDPEAAVLAHNAMLCGLAKYQRVDQCWLLYKKCEKENIPLNLTTYNCIIIMFGRTSGKKNVGCVKLITDILKSMAEKGVKPDVKTLNATLNVVNVLPPDAAINFMNRLCEEFKELNIKFSLATYHYILKVLVKKGSESYNDIMNILRTMSKETFTIRDRLDFRFFSSAMYIALLHYTDKKMGNMINEIYETGDNYKFIVNYISDHNYYDSYLTLLLLTSTPQEFFEYYEKYVPNTHVPSHKLIMKIVDKLKFHKYEIENYVVKLWSDVTEFGYMDHSLKLSLLSLIDANNLPAESPSRSFFIFAALNTWDQIKDDIDNKSEWYKPVESALLGYLIEMLLWDDHINKSIEVLTCISEKPDLFLPTITANQLVKLFTIFISKQCIQGAFLVMEYSATFGFEEFKNMGKKLYKLPELSNADRKKLINFLGEETLNASNILESS